MDRELVWLVIRIALLLSFSGFLLFLIIYISKTLKEKSKEVNFKLPDLDEEFKKELKSNIVPAKDSMRIKAVNDDKEFTKIERLEENENILDDWEEVLKKQNKKIIKRLPNAEKAIVNSEHSVVYQKDNFEDLMRELQEDE